MMDENSHYLVYVIVSGIMCRSSFAPKIPILINAIMYILGCFDAIAHAKPNGLIAKFFGKTAKIVD